MSVNGKQVFSFLTLLYIFWYCWKVVHRPKLYFASNSLTTAVTKQCKSSRQRYFPLFLFHSSYFQLFLSVIINNIYIKIYKPKYDREMFALSDGQKVALDWTFPKRFNQNDTHKPIVIGLYGIAGNNTSLNILRYCKLICQRLGYASVVMGRRGHECDIELTIPKMSVFGLQTDIHECILHISQRYPLNPLILLGDSAGTGFWVRYTGDLALCINEESKLEHHRSPSQSIIKEYPQAQRIHDQILCAVLISPGYDLREIFSNQSWFSQQLILFILKQTFVRNHTKCLMEKNEDVVRKCDQSTSMIEFFETYSGALSGFESYNEFLLEVNPTETGQYAQIPALIINSRDDPICTATSLDEWKWLFTEKKSCPNAILVETKFGSHSAFFSAFGGFWLDNVILEYIQTVYDIERESIEQNQTETEP